MYSKNRLYGEKGERKDGQKVILKGEVTIVLSSESNKNKDQNVDLNKEILDLSKKSPINTLIDLHGHSRKMFSFFYGNPNSDSCLARIFPYLCSKLGPNMIRF